MEDGYTKKTMKLSELGSFRKENFEKMYEENKQEILAKVKDAYYIYDDKLAAEIFEAGAGSVSRNGPGDEEEETSMYSKSRYLLLSLPLNDGEIEQRQHEYETFVKELNDPDLTTADDLKVVKTKKNMLQCISLFLKEKDNAFENVIVLNGHGTDGSKGGGQGLCFADEEQNMPLDDVIREISKISGELKLGMVCIIFAQCWAHLHSPTDDVTVIYFTSQNKPTTRSFPRIHLDLSKYTSVLRQVTPGEYLLLSAPRKTEKTFKIVKLYGKMDVAMTGIMDEAMRQQQFKNFIAALDEDIRPNPEPEPVVVTNWGPMLGAIRRFLVEGNSQKVIIFNGHGKRKGLCLAERGWDDLLDLNYVISEVAKEVKKITQQVQLIFAQNYGHLYTKAAMGGVENFEVIPLTDERIPVTFMHINTKKRKKRTSYHLQLEEYARQLNDANKQNATSANSTIDKLKKLSVTYTRACRTYTKAETND